MVHKMLRSAVNQLHCCLNAIADTNVLSIARPTCLIKPPLAMATESGLRIDAVYLSVCSSIAKNAYKTRFSQKLSNLNQWSLLTTNRKSYISFSKNPLLNPWNSRWQTSAILKIA